MKRNANELSNQFRDVVASQSEDAIASFLEDLNDSVVEAPDTANMVDRSELEKITAERDAALASAASYRDRYINRFYQPRNDTQQYDSIVSETPQSKVEQDEKFDNYESLFE